MKDRGVVASWGQRRLRSRGTREQAGRRDMGGEGSGGGGRVDQRRRREGFRGGSVWGSGRGGGEGRTRPHRPGVLDRFL